jgi:hypothetical protein
LKRWQRSFENIAREKEAEVAPTFPFKKPPRGLGAVLTFIAIKKIFKSH